MQAKLDERVLRADASTFDPVSLSKERSLEALPPTDRSGDLPALILAVCRDLDISPDDLKSASRNSRISNARAVVATLGAERLGISRAMLAGVLGLTQSGVTKACRRGAMLLQQDPNSSVFADDLIA
jgi:chromosomal replication initiation ATPase DnaA